MNKTKKLTKKDKVFFGKLLFTINLFNSITYLVKLSPQILDESVLLGDIPKVETPTKTLFLLNKPKEYIIFGILLA